MGRVDRTPYQENLISTVPATTQRLYLRAPYPLKVVAASLHGRRLSARRYSADTPKMVSQAIERETWGRSRWQEWQQQTLETVLQNAAIKIPYYSNYWDQHGGTSNNPRVLNLDQWPVLQRTTVRANPSQFLDPSIARSKLLSWTTSGSSGTPLTMFASRDTVRAWYGLAEARWRHWYGLDRNQSWAIFGGQQVTDPKRSKPPFWVWNSGLHQLYMSVYHLTDDTTASYLKALQDHRIHYLYGYTSALVDLAVRTRRLGCDIPPLACAITNAEPITAEQRKLIEEGLGCPVKETYGMAEMVAAASECNHGRLHWWHDAGHLEHLSLDQDRPADRSEVGRLVVTGLLNPVMPLIRYEVGDLGVLDDPSESCSCGRSLRVVREITGRIEDAVITPDGRSVTRFHAIYYGLPVVAGQVIQRNTEQLAVRVVLADGIKIEEVEPQLRQNIADRVGPMEVTVEAVDALLTGAGGKVRGVISRLDRNQTEASS